MELVFGVFYFLFGTIVGSFLNVVAFRYNTGHTMGGRSVCLSCQRQLVWFELIPGVSFLIQRGKCRSCGSVLSLQYPLVELLTGLLFLGLFLKSGSNFAFISLAFIFCFYIVIGIYDIRHSIVPNGLAYGAAFFTFVLLFLNIESMSIIIPTIANFLGGPVVAAPLFFIWLFSGGRWMGLGDAKLMLSVGWLLGIAGGFAALLLGFWSGALFGVMFLLYQRTKQKRMYQTGTSELLERSLHSTMKSEIPFAPFLLLGCFCAFFFDLNILNLLLWSL